MVFRVLTLFFFFFFLCFRRPEFIVIGGLLLFGVATSLFFFSPFSYCACRHEVANPFFCCTFCAFRRPHGQARDSAPFAGFFVNTKVETPLALSARSPASFPFLALVPRDLFRPRLKVLYLLYCRFIISAGSFFFPFSPFSLAQPFPSGYATVVSRFG